jgi:hypothetical protein
MLQPGMFANPARMPIFVLCILCAGFMVRFLIAIAAGLGKAPKVVRKISEITYEQPLRSSKGTVNPAGRLALGVMRITSSLTPNLSRGNEEGVVGRHLVGLRVRTRTIDSASEHGYREQ